MVKAFMSMNLTIEASKRYFEEKIGLQYVFLHNGVSINSSFLDQLYVGLYQSQLTVRESLDRSM